MPYLLNSPQTVRDMLAAIGVASIEELLEQVPASVRMTRPLDIPAAKTELELTAHMSRLASRNTSADDATCFLGGGAYDHFVPAAVDMLASRGEFYTSYTPYQAEASQGNLKVLFEYQTLITQLTGMDVSNASLYEGGTAVVEAVLMSVNQTGRAGRVVVAESVHPEYRQILSTYLENLEPKITTVGAPGGTIAPEDLEAAVDETTSCVVIQQPNFFGSLEDLKTLIDIAHAKGALAIVSVDPVSLGVLKRPGDLGADIVVAEGQGLGNYMSFGGPYLGIMACRDELMRRLPGRIVGETTDRTGQRCWVLTLQTREQHIRRDKATSNICTNQGLLALRSTIYLSLLGPQGMREVANLCLQKAHYAAEKLTADGRLSMAFDRPFFKEFAVRVAGGQVDAFLEELRNERIFGGLALGRWYPELDDCVLLAVTEKRTRSEIDAYAAAVARSKTLQAAGASV